MPLAAGTFVDRYRIESLIGTGGMGEVYRATDLKLDRPVALKFVQQALATGEARQRFVREARAITSLNHPHIVTVYETGRYDGRDYLATEFVDGGTLGAWARAEKPGWRQVVERLIGVADGLAMAHEAGILHRDVKPDNILIASTGYAKLADFGLAKPVDSPGATRATEVSPTRHGEIVGTLHYMSPEQTMGKPLDARSDIFSFGVVLYELLAGRRPFNGPTDLHLIDAVLKATPEPLPDAVPASLRALVEKALEKDPGDRYQSMRDLVVDLRRLVRHSEAVPATPVPGGATPTRTLSDGASWPAVAAAVAVVAVTVGAGVWWWARSGGSEPATVAIPTIRSIAVLPMRNLSANVDEEYFADGMTEELISNLAQVHAWDITSTTSVMRFKGTLKPLKDIARELGVDAILESSERRSGGRVRVTAQLIHASTDSHLWAKDFERELSDVLSLQSEIADAIVREVKVQITPDEAGRLAARARQRISPAAFDAYARGMSHMAQAGNPESWKQSIAELEEATRLARDFAPAFANLSMAWQQGRSTGMTSSEGAMRTAVERALDLDPDLGDAHAALAGVKFDDWDWQGSVAAYERAFALDPNSTACACYAITLAALGRFADAMRIAEHGLSVNPLSVDMRFNYGLTLYMQRKYREAEPQFLRGSELEPKNVGNSYYLTRVYVMLGRPDDALSQASRPELQASMALGLAHLAAGHRAEATAVLKSMPAGDHYGRALLHLALGDKDQSLQEIAKAIDVKQGTARWLNVVPDLDPLRGDPRFAAQIARMKLPD